MKTITVRVAIIAVLLAGFAGWNFGRHECAPHPVRPANMPTLVGRYKGGSQQSGLAFQDTSGTLRFVTNIPCDGVPQVALELRRTK